jgi:Tol biopolymer transport system component
VLALIGVTDTATGREAPEGPRLAFVRYGLPLPAEELLSVDPTGHHSFRIARASSGSRMRNTRLFPSEGFSWTADGERIAFGWFPFARDGPHIYTLPAGGGAARPIAGTEGGFDPVFSPDGRFLAFARLRYRRHGGGREPYIGTSIWLIGAQGGRSRQLTPWRDGLFLQPTSFAPDGRMLAAMRFERGKAPEIVSLHRGGGRPSVLIKDAVEAAYSPDGSMIAFVRWQRLKGIKRDLPRSLQGGDLFLASADGSNIERLTFDPPLRESGPSWDPSGERLAYTQYPPEKALDALFGGPGSAIREINTDGTCSHRLLFTFGLDYWRAAWQPGPGREAGRIEC